MLVELRIKNFVLIEELTLHFNAGLNILTGETGAGKSILIDALSGVLGEKMSTDQIRTGFERAILEGVFDISKMPQIIELLDESGIEPEDGQLILRRELYNSGKGRSFANSVQIPVSKMKEIADYLVDIHGQNEHQSIAQVNRHRELLDGFAGTNQLVADIRNSYHRLHQLKDQIASFTTDEKEKGRKIEYLTHALKEIESAKLVPGEEEALRDEANLLANAEKMFTEISDARNILQQEGGLLSGLTRIEHGVSAITKYDPALSEVLDNIKTAFYTLNDVSASLRDYEQGLTFKPERLNEVEERLDLIANLKKKYGDSIEEILQFVEKSSQELEFISTSSEQLDSLKNDYKKEVALARDLAVLLSTKRAEAALKLEKMVMSELSDLNMGGTIFKVNIVQESNPAGEIENNNKVYMLYPHGIDKIEFLLAANQGEALKQLTKVASGGEMSRIMLALKKVILSADIVDTLIFDEVDAGIGGKTADVVGRKLKGLSKERQVLVITHLAQIAALADQHFTVYKEKNNERVFTKVKKLDLGEKVKEVARMLAGENVTELSLEHARELVNLGTKV